MSFQLSPSTVFGLKEHAHDALVVTIPVEEDIDPESVTAYKCPECADLHEYIEDAVDCCAHERAKKLKPEHDVVLCPVCNTDCGDVYDAADCCLWKDLDQPTRRRVALAVENGATWTEQLLSGVLL